MSNIQIFRNENFGEIRVITNEQGEPMFCLADVCSALGIKNSRDVKTRIDEDDVVLTDTIDSRGRTQQATFVTEGGLYTVILRSDAPSAKPFRKWVTSEVLPSIRKTGEAKHTDYSLDEFITSYIPNPIREQMVKEIDGNIYLPYPIESQLRLYAANFDTDVYDELRAEVIVWEGIITMSNRDEGRNSTVGLRYQTYLMMDEACGAIKIGRACDPHFREHTLGAQIPRIKLLATCPNDVERTLHEKYKSKRMRGEWFSLSQKDINEIMKDYDFRKTKAILPQNPK